MRLTVGPLPAAVYWRRRLLVLGVLVLAVLVIVYSCTGGPGAGNQAGPGPSGTASATTTPADSSTSTPSASATSTPTPTPTGTPTPTAFTLPVTNPDPTGPCIDEEIELTATASRTTLTLGEGANFILQIKNVSTRSCVRDIGSIPQELQLWLGETIAWSSDDCRDAQVLGPDYNFDHTFAPGSERSFEIYWNGYRSRTGTDAKDCTASDQMKPDAGTYELIARLGTKHSTPTTVAIRSS